MPAVLAATVGPDEPRHVRTATGVTTYEVPVPGWFGLPQFPEHPQVFAALSQVERTATVTVPATESETPEPAEFEDVPWETLQDYLAAPRGRYTKVHGVNESGAQTTMLQETTRYDLEAGYLERTIEIPADGMPSEQAALAPDGLTFGVIQTGTAYYMSVPGIEESCGASWVDLTSSDNLPSVPGLTDDLLALIIEPLDVLDQAVGEPVHVETTAEGSTYEVALPAAAGLTIAAEQRTNPSVVDTLTSMETVAEVLLPPDGGALEVSIDFSEVMGELSGQPFPEGTVMRSYWALITDLEPFDTSLPADIADGSCLAGPTQG
ncbi:hypothetical protein [Jiangella mangrovi]|uniref:Uncharacterized protein n=1 Tax=Jiangella mangrovi TaxID=1524084 RepID=A0A7W9GWI6_9ACTN|nr:hypothetical protein [Jiangella mangrovi]MBB5791357.1 hypothetical protein [Jiangella mangrovi]